MVHWSCEAHTDGLSSELNYTAAARAHHTITCSRKCLIFKVIAMWRTWPFNHDYFLQRQSQNSEYLMLTYMETYYGGYPA